jgi:hypothetical protein
MVVPSTSSVPHFGTDAPVSWRLRKCFAHTRDPYDYGNRRSRLVGGARLVPGVSVGAAVFLHPGFEHVAAASL